MLRNTIKLHSVIKLWDKPITLLPKITVRCDNAKTAPLTQHIKNVTRK